MSETGGNESDPLAMQDDQTRTFAPGLVLRRDTRELIVDGEPVAIRERAFHILELLVDAKGGLVTKDEIMARVWANVVVEENNLQVHISAIRKALGKDRSILKTVSGRGYRLSPDPISLKSADAPPSAPLNTNFPLSLPPLVGREAELLKLSEHLSAKRLVTLAGMGGIGKTRLALELASSLRPAFSDGTWLVELAALKDSEFVAATVATSLRIEFPGGLVSAARVAQELTGRRALIVIDNCEHVIYRAAEMAEMLVHYCPHLMVICTSREPLRAEGEFVYWVPPLSVPAAQVTDIVDLRSHSAVELFLSRAAPQSSHNDLAPTAATICRRLDGIPLAIELAAARAQFLGADELAKGLEQRFLALTGGRRTAVPRQQTMRATLDWSYDLLSDEERVVLHTLAVFSGWFTLDALRCVLSEISDVAEHLASLVAKSLVVTGGDPRASRFRLVEVTRAYAMEKLIETGERGRVSLRHALCIRDQLVRIDSEWDDCVIAEWLQELLYLLDNIRAALDWAFSPDGDVELGVKLAGTAVPLLFDLSLAEECYVRAERALAAIEQHAPARDSRSQLQLRTAYAGAIVYTRGPFDKARTAWEGVLALSQEVEDVEYQARALWGLWNANVYCGEPSASLRYAVDFNNLADQIADEAKQLLALRAKAISLHYMGEQIPAQKNLERLISRYDRSVHRWRTVGFRVDHGIVAKATLARSMWVQGFPDTAAEVLRGALADAEAYGHSLTTAYLLVEAVIPIAFLRGDDPTKQIALLIDMSIRNNFRIWEVCGRCFEEMELTRSEGSGARLPLFKAAMQRLNVTGFRTHIAFFSAVLADGWCEAGDIQQGLSTINEAIESVERTGEMWCLPELLRIKGNLLLATSDERMVEQGEVCLVRSLERSRSQLASSWALRASHSLAKVLAEKGKVQEAIKILDEVCSRLTEGFSTNDFVSARSLLSRLQGCKL